MTRHRLITLLLATALSAVTIIAAPHDKRGILTLKNSITDDDIVFPESFDTDVHQMMTNWYLQNYAVLDADVENKAPGEASDETFIKRLAAIPSVIEMPYNQIVRKHIERYVYRSRTLVEEMLGMSLYYMPIFEQALEKEGLPLELKYLPIVESALDPNAVSHAGAAGLWQFMIGTGKGLGLEINSLVDERRDPYRSSAMAAKYLKNLYQIYNDWSLAIAAYNCGPGNVNKALHRNGGTGDFWDIYEYLPRETRGYVPAFIAANYAMTYYKQHNISPSLARKPLITDTVVVTRRIHFAQIAQVLNIPIEEIRTFNPQYRKDVIPGDNHPYVLVLPSQQIYSYIMSEDSIDNYRDDLYAHRPIVEPGGLTPTTEEYLTGVTASGQVRTTTHRVAKGETMSTIAAMYNMTTDELMTLNGKSNERLRRGETLKVKAPTYGAASADNDEIVPVTSDNNPPEGDVATANTDNEQAQFDEVREVQRTAADKPYNGSYTAQSAQPAPQATTQQAKPAKSDSQAARQQASRSNSRDWRDRNSRYSTSTTARESKGRRHGDTSERSSKSSKRSKKQSKPKQPTEVTVQRGESLTSIAERTGVSVSDLERANGIADGNKIKAGDRIKIPTQAEARQAAANEKKAKGRKAKSSSTKSTSGKSSSTKSSGKSSTGKSSSGKSSSGKSSSSKKKSKK